MYAHKNGLTLRKAEEYDLHWLQQAKNSSWTTQHRTVFLNYLDQDKWFKSLDENSYHMVAMKNPDDQEVIGLVSIVGVDWISRTASVGMMATLESRGKEWTPKLPEVITDFGFEVLNLHRLEAEVLESNLAALKFDLSLGYQVEGRKKQAIYKSGVYHDSFMIAMLRDQWESSERVNSYGGICNTTFKKRLNVDRVVVKYSRT